MSAMSIAVTSCPRLEMMCGKEAGPAPRSTTFKFSPPIDLNSLSIYIHFKMASS